MTVPEDPRGSPVPVQVTTKKEKLNIGVVGIGRMGQRHAINLLFRTNRCNLVCVCSPAQADLKWAEENLKPHGVAVYPTFEEMIATPGLQAVVISSVTHLHPYHTLECMKRGIHVLCEKPIAKSIEQLQQIIQTAEASPQPRVMVGFTRRFDENYQDALEKIKAGVIGSPVVIRSQGCEKLDNSEFFRNYLRTSGGIFIDSIVHDIDLAISFFGEDVQPKSVWAAGVAAHYKEELEADGDADNAVGMCEFWGGKIAYFYNSRTSAHGYDNATEIFGTAGKISINLVARRNRLELGDTGGIRIETTPSWSDRYSEAFVTEMIAFVDAILDNQPLPIPLRSALTSLRIATALQHSLKTGQKVDFDKNGNRINKSSI